MPCSDNGVTDRRGLLDVRETLTPSDHQSHRHYRFQVPDGCARLEIRASYSPKHLDELHSTNLAIATLRAQSDRLAARVSHELARRWSADLAGRAERVRIPNLLTVSLDDATGAYRGAAHRQARDQTLVLAADTASPGLVAGHLPAGDWTLVLSVHTLVSSYCEVSIQIGADIATSAP